MQDRSSYTGIKESYLNLTKMSLLKWMSNVSPFRGLPVDDKKTSGTVSSTSTETVQLMYNNAGTLTNDAGQAAGVVVVGKMAYDNIKNKVGDAIGKKGDTSLSFTCTALTTEVGLGSSVSGNASITPEFVESLDTADWATRMAAIGARLSNGQYFVDYAKGTIYGKKTTTASTMTSTTYNYGASASSGGGVSATDNAAFTAGSSETTPFAALVDEVSTGSVTEGNSGAVRMTATRELRNAETYAPLYENNSLQRAMTLQGVSYTNISASALIKTGSGYLAGFIVNSAAAGATIKLWDNTSAATTVLLNTITYTAAASQGGAVNVFASPIAFGTGLYCTIAVAAMDVTLLWL